MSDNRTRSQDRLDWLDDAVVERLLRGEAAGARAEPLARLLAAAARPSAVDPVREEAALTAFRTVHDEDALVAGSRIPGLARLRGRRPGGPRRAVRPAKALAGALVATAALGGVAVAAGALPTPFGGGSTWPVLTHSAAGSGQHASAVPGGTYSATPDQDRPAGGTSRGVPSPTPAATVGAVAAGKLCRAYSAAKTRGEEMDDASYQQLKRAAGGRQAMYGYCAGLLGWDRAGSWTQPGTDSGTDTGTGAGKSQSPTNGSEQQSWDAGGGSSGGGGSDASAGGDGSNAGSGKGDAGGIGHGTGNGMSGVGSDGAGRGR
ncbi:hypothetical protein [Actinacidiphila oryziradicis]|uniref:hypothetical protein n=1 Tax=Actinacidiphila oryziradicis TaxID=2571141 RepID=UPI0023F244DC|nr:hypothetical protein [Actinacidiphila oryziradicis]MCW2871258.1 hypothetical protein [Actinacidiphila oryziradicis]